MAGLLIVIPVASILLSFTIPQTSLTARAEYESKSAIIQSQDKQLEIELKQFETQHQAAQTEYDSVKKVIQDNVERTFGIFS